MAGAAQGEGPAGEVCCAHRLLLSRPLVLHTGKRWFIICPVAEHPAAEAPESSPPLPLNSVQPEASPGRTSHQATCWGQPSSAGHCSAPGPTPAGRSAPVTCAPLNARTWPPLSSRSPEPPAGLYSSPEFMPNGRTQACAAGCLGCGDAQGCTGVCWKRSSSSSYQCHVATPNSLPCPLAAAGRDALPVLGGKVPCSAETLILNCLVDGYQQACLWTVG